MTVTGQPTNNISFFQIKLKAQNTFQAPLYQADELGSVVVVAAELKDPTMEGKSVKEPVVPRPAPPTARSVLACFSKF